MLKEHRKRRKRYTGYSLLLWLCLFRERVVNDLALLSYTVFIDWLIGISVILIMCKVPFFVVFIVSLFSPIPPSIKRYKRVKHHTSSFVIFHRFLRLSIVIGRYYLLQPPYDTLYRFLLSIHHFALP